MLLRKALAILRPSPPFQSFTRRAELEGPSDRSQPDPILSADTMTAPFSDTKGHLAFLTVV
jgi:hypothetical protein